MPYPRLIELLESWQDSPPLNEAFLGFIGFKPVPKEERRKREAGIDHALRRSVGPDVPYEQLPKWLRDIHAAQKENKSRL